MESIDQNKCIVVIDFKENIRIGGGPVETKANFYEQKMISDLGIAVLYKDKKGNNTKSYYNFFSEILTHDALYPKQCLSELFKREEMQRYDTISIWSDGGNHFRSREFLAGVFEELHFNLKKVLK